MGKTKGIAWKAALAGLFFFWGLASTCAQTEEALRFEQVDSLQKLERKPVMVFIHTDWCRYCERMEQTTFRNKKVKELLEKHFYFIELDAEAEQDISVRGKSFRYRPSGNGTGLHELALELGMVEGQLSFPTLTFLNADNEIIYQQSGFVTPKALAEILQNINSGSLAR